MSEVDAGLLPGLRQSGERTDLFRRQQSQQRGGAGHIENRAGKSADPGGARDHLARVVNLAAEDRGHFQSDKSEGDLRPKIQAVEVQVGHQMKAGGQSVARCDGDAEYHQQRGEQIAGGPAQNAGPFTRAQAHQVQKESQPKRRERGRNSIARVFGIANAGWAEHVAGNRRTGEQQRGEVANIADEVEPGAQESMPIAEGAFGPDVEPAFLRKLLAQARDHQSARQEESESSH